MATRLSHSALSDFRRCGRYYYLKRVLKLKPDKESHSLQAGSLVHSCYYFAHADPTKIPGSWRMTWALTGRVDRNRALAMYDSLWAGEISPNLSSADYPHFMTLMSDQKPWSEVEFRKGKIVALKVEGQSALKAAWGAHFRSILAAALELPLPGKLTEIEREVKYHLGTVEMLGFIDLVVKLPNGLEGAIDLKTTHDKPGGNALEWNVQQTMYYLTGFSQLWLWHLRSNELLEIPKNQWLTEALQEGAESMHDAIEAGLFIPRFDEECAFCDVRKHCRAKGN